MFAQGVCGARRNAISRRLITDHTAIERGRSSDLSKLERRDAECVRCRRLLVVGGWLRWEPSFPAACSNEDRPCKHVRGRSSPHRDRDARAGWQLVLCHDTRDVRELARRVFLRWAEQPSGISSARKRSYQRKDRLSCSEACGSRLPTVLIDSSYRAADWARRDRDSWCAALQWWRSS